MKNLSTLLSIIIAIGFNSIALSQMGQKPVDNTGVEPGTLPGSFSVSVNGAAVYSIPLDVPAGRAGMTPNLALVYNSQQGGNILGKGWGLAGFSSISRTNPTIYYNGQPDNIDFVNDQLILDGQKMIPLSESEFRLENDPSIKIEYLVGDFDDYFKVSYGNGLVKEYGNSEDSRQEYSPEGPDFWPLIWHINKIKDPSGNKIVFSYGRNPNTGELHPFEIKYTGYEENGQEINQGSYIVSFHYEILDDPYWQTSYFQKGTAEYVNVTSHILKNIDIKYADENETIKNFEFIYSNENTNVLNEYFLTGVNVKVSSDEGEKVMKGASFNWSFYHPDYKSQQEVESDTTIVANYGIKKICKINISGTNKDDVAVSKLKYIQDYFTAIISLFYNNLGQEIIIPVNNATPVEPMAIDFDFNGDEELIFTDDDGVKIYDFELQQNNEWIASMVYNSNYQGKAKIGDIDGDGLMDFFLVGGSACYFYKGTGMPENPFEIQNIELPFENEDQFEALADFNGDGKADIMRRKCPDYDYEIYSYLPDDGFQLLTELFYAAFDPEITILASYVDLNGDMKTDLCFTKQEEGVKKKDCFFSYGDYFITPGINKVIEWLPSLVMDMNNDGRADFIQLFENGTTLKIAYGMPDGLSCSDDYEFNLTINQIINGIYDMILADIDGNGVQDLVTEFYRHVPLESPISIEVEDPATRSDVPDLDPPPSGKLLMLYSLLDDGFSSDLITSFENGLGAKTEVRYIPSNQQPEIYGEYPVTKSTEKNYLVSTSWLSDGGSNIYNRMSYKFSLPLMHRIGKGFLGFEKVEVINSQDNTFTITENAVFHQGMHYFFSYPEYSRTYSLVGGQQGDLLSETMNSMSIKVFHATEPPVYRPVMSISQTNSWENDAEHSYIKTSATFVSTDDIDNYGNLSKHISCADQDPIPTFAPPEVYDFSSTKQVIYLIDEENWLVSRPASVEIINKSATDPMNDVSYTEYIYYERGEQGSNGVVSWPYLKQKTVTPNNEAQMALSSTYDFDRYGNVVKTEQSAPNSNPALPAVTTYYEFDETYRGRFLTLKREGTRNQPFFSEYHYDEITGLLMSETNPQGLQTSYEYDSFGRLMEVTPPDNIKIQTLIEWSNGDEDMPDGALFSVTNQKILNLPIPTESEKVKTFFNIFGQDIRTVTRGLNETIIYTDKKYDQNGRLWQVFEPYFSNAAPAHYVEYNYDELGRVVRTILPAKSIQVSYHGRNITTLDEGTGVSITKTLDALGRVIDAIDPSGNIYYDYYSSGLVKSINTLGNLTEFTYDAAGNQQSLSDPDAGNLEYTYNAYGLLTRQCDAKGNTYTLSYDELNRLSEKVLLGEGTQARYSYYDNFLTPGYGMPERIDGTDGIIYSYEYDDRSRLHSIREEFDGTSAITSYDYNTFDGRLFRITYPTGYQLIYGYDNFSGDLFMVSNREQGKILWQANATNARGQLTGYTSGNVLTTYKGYDEFGFVCNIYTLRYTNDNNKYEPSEPGDNIREVLQNLNYQFDPVTGNLSSRSAATTGPYLTENFYYDDLLRSRLTGWQVEGQAGQGAFFHPNGNILMKSGITSGGQNYGMYVYGQGAGPHAVTGITNPTPEYRLHSTPQDIVYTAFNKVKQITQEFAPPSDDPGDETWRLDITYGPDEQRKRTRLYRDDRLVKTKYFVGSLYEEEHTDQGVRRLHYLYGGDGLFAIYVMNGTTNSTYYIHKDYLGSYDLITDEQGNVLERLSFDPWGRRRNPTDWTFNNVPASHLFDRGYTGHEHLDIFGLINMNGRVYDPWLGRFLSPDPFVQSPGYSQSYNRYSYCLNNPLKYTDPSGYTYKPNDWDMQPSSTAPYFGPGYRGNIGPGSGNHWSDPLRSEWGNFMLMSGETFINFYDAKKYEEQLFRNTVGSNSITFTGAAAQAVFEGLVNNNLDLYEVYAYGKINYVLLEGGKNYDADYILSGHSLINGGAISLSWMINEVTIAAQGNGGNGFNIDNAVNYLNENAKAQSQHRCAYFVRQALEAGGINTNPHPGTAREYGPFLQGWGFNNVEPTNYSPVKGDIRVFQPYPNGNSAGHIDMYNGNQWMSDFRENNAFPGSGYRNSSYQIFRWPGSTIP